MKNEQNQQNQQNQSVITGAFFFDGTGNNKKNSTNNPSVFGNITNIAKLFDACVISEKFYIEGVGTQDDKEDSSWAKGTGFNPFGDSGYSYRDKLDKALANLNKMINDHPSATFELFIYGFSRGATLARDFTKRALANAKVKVKFLGIYDTVVSLLLQYPSIHMNDSEMNRIDQIVHLCAAQECRSYFPLTSILSRNNSSELITIKNSYTAKVKEIFVPGAHADLGGGYLLDAENLYLNEFAGSCDGLFNDLLVIKNTQRDHFSCKDAQSIWTSLLGDNVKCKSLLIGNNLASERAQVKIDMSTVYFEAMASYTNTYFATTIFSFNGSITIPSLLQLKDKIQNYLIGNIPLNGPCYDYYADYANFTHISANYGNVSVYTVNDILNTFEPGLLHQEVQKMKDDNPNVDLSSYDVMNVYNAFGLLPYHVNQPNNSKWQRKVIYG